MPVNLHVGTNNEGKSNHEALKEYAVDSHACNVIFPSPPNYYLLHLSENWYCSLLVSILLNHLLL